MEKRHEVLFTQLSSYRGELLDIVSSVSAAEADNIPKGFNNNIRWNLGHVYVDQYLWLKALTKEEIPFPAKLNEWFGYGTDPSRFTDETPALPELVTLLREQPEIIREKYRDRMDEEFAPTDMGMFTVEQVLVRTIFHEGLHIGAILAIKRQLSTQ
ncbi:DinB family protein [Paenibacillus sp. M1]|uniref:DinB family protein n=1 Tax=Paenibacillus haidiansis TaxID=1574488 RepID=A0ABU7VPS0_9BACL